MKALLLAAVAAVILPAAAQARPVWTFDRDDAGHARLIFADPEDGGEGDPPMLTCTPRGQMTVLTYADGAHFPLHTASEQSQERLDRQGRPGPWPAQVRVSSGGVTAMAPGHAEYGGEMNDTSVVRGVLPLTSPVIRAFRTTGRLRLVAFGEDAGLTPVPQPLLRRFMAACR